MIPPSTQSVLMGESLRLRYCILTVEVFPTIRIERSLLVATVITWKKNREAGCTEVDQSIDFSITSLPVDGSKFGWFLLNWSDFRSVHGCLKRSEMTDPLHQSFSTCLLQRNPLNNYQVRLKLFNQG